MLVVLLESRCLTQNELCALESASDSCFVCAPFFCCACVCVADKFATLDTMHALCLPLGASISLLVMFFFFDSMQMLFAVATAGE